MGPTPRRWAGRQTHPPPVVFFFFFFWGGFRYTRASIFFSRFFEYLESIPSWFCLAIFGSFWAFRKSTFGEYFFKSFLGFLSQVFVYKALGQKECPQAGPEVDGSVFPLTNSFFLVPGIFDPHINIFNIFDYVFAKDLMTERLRERRAKDSRKITLFSRRMAVLFRKNIGQSSYIKQQLIIIKPYNPL